MLKPGREFESAVYEFVKALDPSAEVIFDHRVPDRDVPGKLRQVDVWVNAKLGGHIPVSILVSCKDHKRKLSIREVGTFLDEVRSTGANTGVIYSRSGFTKDALQKASANATSCCRFYQNAPADRPASMIFFSYLCAPRYELALSKRPARGIPDAWVEIFDMPVNVAAGESTVLEELGQAAQRAETVAVGSERSPRCFPSDMSIKGSFVSRDDPGLQFSIVLRLSWRRYRGRLDAHLLNGSYCFRDQRFHGSQTTPVIDMQGPHPGEGWEEILEHSRELPERHVLAILKGGRFEDVARRSLGHHRPLISSGS